MPINLTLNDKICNKHMTGQRVELGDCQRPDLKTKVHMKMGIDIYFHFECWFDIDTTVCNTFIFEYMSTKWTYPVFNACLESTC